MTRLHAPLLLAALVVACQKRAASVRAGDLAIEPGYATAAPTGDGGAAYFTIRNDAAQPDTIRSVSVDGASASHLHATTRVGGMMRMTLLDPAVVPGHGALALAVGGVHLMFEGTAKRVGLGDTVTVRLRFARGGAVSFPLAVRPYGG